MCFCLCCFPLFYFYLTLRDLTVTGLARSAQLSSRPFADTYSATAGSHWALRPALCPSSATAAMDSCTRVTYCRLCPRSSISSRIPIPPLSLIGHPSPPRSHVLHSGALHPRPHCMFDLLTSSSSAPPCCSVAPVHLSANASRSCPRSYDAFLRTQYPTVSAYPCKPCSLQSAL